jgi:hypothetical protein
VGAALETVTDVVVAAFATATSMGELVEPVRTEPGAGENTAVSDSGEDPALNVVVQVAM